MSRLFIWVILFITFSAFTATAQEFETDTIETSAGNLEITFIGHGALMFRFDGKVIHVDPWTRLADYSTMPKADVILITHDHRDHIDLKALELIRTGKSKMVLTQTSAKQIKDGIVMRRGYQDDCGVKDRSGAGLQPHTYAQRRHCLPSEGYW